MLMSWARDFVTMNGRGCFHPGNSTTVVWDHQVPGERMGEEWAYNAGGWDQVTRVPIYDICFCPDDRGKDMWPKETVQPKVFKAFLRLCDMFIHQCAKSVPKSVRCRKETILKDKVRRQHERALSKVPCCEDTKWSYSCKAANDGWLVGRRNGSLLWTGCTDLFEQSSEHEFETESDADSVVAVRAKRAG